jgi:hypothetical protein
VVGISSLAILIEANYHWDRNFSLTASQLKEHGTRRLREYLRFLPREKFTVGMGHSRQPATGSLAFPSSEFFAFGLSKVLSASFRYRFLTA